MARFEFEFDFDQWRELADKDPAAFFAQREALLERFIATAPARLTQDLRGLQSRIDHSRAEAGTPVLAARQLMGLLGDHLGALAGHVRQLQTQSCELAAMLPKAESADE